MDTDDEVYSLLEKGHLTMSLLREGAARMSSFISWCHCLEPVTSSWVWQGEVVRSLKGENILSGKH